MQEVTIRSRRLCQEGFACAKEMGCDYITASCRRDGSERFYLALEMEECGRIPGGIREPWGGEKVFDELIFYKHL